ncbi:MAG: RNA polymerase sigma factor [Candidatus Aminicenantes bacterium]|nr:RNA polymerase sigma factor [Candidatus Aminicenantes bacterium]
MNEADLIAACLAGRREEFRHIVYAYKSQVMALALNILGNREDAEDACQDTFVQVFRHLAAYDPGRSFRTWIFMIVHRRCLDTIRRKKRFSRFFQKAAWENGPEESKGPEPAAPGGVVDASMLSALRPKERAALTLWANEGLSTAEIAAVIECAPSTARVYLFHARRKLKALIEERKKTHGTLGAR